jgi:hypothetical protein
MKIENTYLETLNKLGILILLVFTMSLFSTQIFGVELQMEWGTVTTTNENWLEVDLQNNYVNPIIVVTPEYSFNPSTGIDSWVTNVTTSNFLIRTSNDLFTNSNSISVHYIVMEKGAWTLPGTSIKVEAGELSTTKAGVRATDWSCPTYGETIIFTSTFDSNPLVISSRGTNNNPSAWLTTFQHDPASLSNPVTSSQMCIGLSHTNSPTPDAVVSPETVYWIAADSGFGDLSGTEFEILMDASNWLAGATTNIAYTRSWARTWSSPPTTILGSVTSIAGSDGSWPVIFDIGNLVSLRMLAEEADGGAHAAESGGGWAFAGSGSIGNDPPQNIEVLTNKTQVVREGSIGINATITDKLGNNTVSNVTVTIQDFNNTKYNVSLNPELFNLNLTTPDLETGTQGYTAVADSGILGETGELLLANRESKLITFTQTYSQTPILIAIAASQNNDDSAYIPILHSINTTHANISLCRDNGATTCDNSYTAETVNYAIFDITKSNFQSWIEVGTVDALTDGSVTPFVFGKTFTSSPSVFALPQTYNIDGTVTNGIAAHSWFDTTSTTGASIVGCDHPGTADDCAGTATETFGYVAIDFANANLDKFSSGVESISNSAWTAITFGQTYTNSNVFVMVQEETGAQDGKYPWAKSITTTGADIRYCEEDAANVCNSHNAENTAWFALESGVIRLTGSTSDIDGSGFPITYEDSFSQTTHILNVIDVIINISNYNNSGSVANVNTNPQLQIELLDNTNTWVNIGLISPTSTGQYTISTTNSNILYGWTNEKFRDIKLTPINLDYSSGIIRDTLEWTDVQIFTNYTHYSSHWLGEFTDTNVCNLANITDMYSYDNVGLLNHSIYSNKSFMVTCGPKLDLIYPMENLKLFTSGDIEFIYNVTTYSVNTSCDILINGIIQQTTMCVDGLNYFNYSLDLGYYNWTIFGNNSNGYNTTSSTFNFLNLFDENKKLTKAISRVGTDIYKVDTLITNNANFSSDIISLEFIENKLVIGAPSLIYDFTNVTFNNYVGTIYGWDFLLAKNSTTSYNYPITYTPGFRRIEDLFIIGFE